MNRTQSLGLVLGVVCGLAFLSGCEQKKTAPTGSPPPGPMMQRPDGTLPAGESGRAVFESQGCVNCHAVGTTPARGKGGAPDLGKVAADEKHTREWLIAFIKNPRKDMPYGKMPPYEGKINDADMAKLADYLMAQK